MGCDGGLLVSKEGYDPLDTKNYRGRWYTLVLAYSAVGVIISFVFITDKGIRDENRDYRKYHVEGKLKNKEKTISWIHSNCHALSSKNEKKTAMTTANKLTLVAY